MATSALLARLAVEKSHITPNASRNRFMIPLLALAAAAPSLHSLYGISLPVLSVPLFRSHCADEPTTFIFHRPIPVSMILSIVVQSWGIW